MPRRYALPPLSFPGTLKYQDGGVALASNVGQSEEFVALRENVPVQGVVQGPRNFIASALAESGERLKGIEAGADDFVLKPFDATELRARVQSLLASGRGQSLRGPSPFPRGHSY